MIYSNEYLYKYLQWLYYKYEDVSYNLRKSKLRSRLQISINNAQEFLDDPTCIQTLRASTLSYTESMRVKNQPYGQYRFSESVKEPTLYASACAALTRHLYGDLNNLSPEERQQWITYILDHQSDDGLFKDPLISNDLASNGDSWGWRHLTLHVLMALTCLGTVAPKKFQFLEPFKDPDFAIKWLENRNWKRCLIASDLSNQIQNYITFLQYTRDFQGEKWAEVIVDKMLDWLDERLDPKTGLWGDSFHTSALLSLGVMFAYHLWLLYFYDKRPVKYTDRIIDSCLSTQNELGGFGIQLNSNACEDIDSIDPIVRLTCQTQYRKRDIQSCLQKALPWVLANRNKDGGFVFKRGEAITIGHKLMHAKIDQSNMFYTWFRTLSLAYLGKALPDSTVGKYPWQFIRCPGHQFW